MTDSVSVDGHERKKRDVCAAPVAGVVDHSPTQPDNDAVKHSRVPLSDEDRSAVLAACHSVATVCETGHTLTCNHAHPVHSPSSTCSSSSCFSHTDTHKHNNSNSNNISSADYAVANDAFIEPKVLPSVATACRVCVRPALKRCLKLADNADVDSVMSACCSMYTTPQSQVAACISSNAQNATSQHPIVCSQHTVANLSTNSLTIGSVASATDVVNDVATVGGKVYFSTHVQVFDDGCSKPCSQLSHAPNSTGSAVVCPDLSETHEVVLPTALSAVATLNSQVAQLNSATSQSDVSVEASNQAENMRKLEAENESLRRDIENYRERERQRGTCDTAASAILSLSTSVTISSTSCSTASVTHGNTRTVSVDDEADDGEDDENGKVVEASPDGTFLKFEAEIGRGSFKTVYKGLDTTEGVFVAWCELQLTGNRLSKKERDRFREEADLMKGLAHANIVRFYDYWEVESPKRRCIVLVTELMTSGTLRTYLKNFGQKKVPLKIIKSWCRQILRGLQFLHSRNPSIIHRDLKCDNLFISGTTGQVKIGDLGLATLKNRSCAKSVIGTPEFMAPEVYEEHYDEAVDVYAFGMCMLEMVTAEYPYSECTGPAQIYKKVVAGIKPVSLDKVEDSDIRSLIDWLTRLDKKERPTVKELLNNEFFFEGCGMRVDVANRDETIASDVQEIEMRLRVLDAKKRRDKHKENEAIQFSYMLDKDNPDEIVRHMFIGGILLEEDTRPVAKMIAHQIQSLLRAREEKRRETALQHAQQQLPSSLCTGGATTQSAVSSHASMQAGTLQPSIPSTTCCAAAVVIGQSSACATAPAVTAPPEVATTLVSAVDLVTAPSAQCVTSVCLVDSVPASSATPAVSQHLLPSLQHSHGTVSQPSALPLLQVTAAAVTSAATVQLSVSTTSTCAITSESVSRDLHSNIDLSCSDVCLSENDTVVTEKREKKKVTKRRKTGERLPRLSLVEVKTGNNGPVVSCYVETNQSQAITFRFDLKEADVSVISHKLMEAHLLPKDDVQYFNEQLGSIISQQSQNLLLKDAVTCTSNAAVNSTIFSSDVNPPGNAITLDYSVYEAATDTVLPAVTTAAEGTAVCVSSGADISCVAGVSGAPVFAGAHNGSRSPQLPSGAELCAASTGSAGSSDQPVAHAVSPTVSASVTMCAVCEANPPAAALSTVSLLAQSAPCGPPHSRADHHSQMGGHTRSVSVDGASSIPQLSGKHAPIVHEAIIGMTSSVVTCPAPKFVTQSHGIPSAESVISLGASVVCTASDSSFVGLISASQTGVASISVPSTIVCSATLDERHLSVNRTSPEHLFLPQNSDSVLSNIEDLRRELSRVISQPQTVAAGAVTSCVTTLTSSPAHCHTLLVSSTNPPAITCVPAPPHIVQQTPCAVSTTSGLVKTEFLRLITVCQTIMTDTFSRMSSINSSESMERRPPHSSITSSNHTPVSAVTTTKSHPLHLADLEKELSKLHGTRLMQSRDELSSVNCMAPSSATDEDHVDAGGLSSGDSSLSAAPSVCNPRSLQSQQSSFSDEMITTERRGRFSISLCEQPSASLPPSNCPQTSHIDGSTVSSVTACYEEPPRAGSTEDTGAHPTPFPASSSYCSAVSSAPTPATSTQQHPVCSSATCIHDSLVREGLDSSVTSHPEYICMIKRHRNELNVLRARHEQEVADLLDQLLQKMTSIVAASEFSSQHPSVQHSAALESALSTSNSGPS